MAASPSWSVAWWPEHDSISIGQGFEGLNNCVGVDRWDKGAAGVAACRLRWLLDSSHNRRRRKAEMMVSSTAGVVHLSQAPISTLIMSSQQADVVALL